MVRLPIKAHLDAASSTPASSISCFSCTKRMPKVLIIPKMIPLTRKQLRRTSQAQQPPSGGSWSEYLSLLVSLLFSLVLVLVLVLVSAIRGVCSVSCLVSIVECILANLHYIKTGGLSCRSESSN